MYYNFKQSAALYNRKQFENSGKLIGDLFYQILKLTDFNEENFDWDSYTKIIGKFDKLKNKEDAIIFTERFKSCINSLELVFFDIRNYYKKPSSSSPSSTPDSNNQKTSVESEPGINDLFKYIFEVQQVMQCLSELKEVLKDLGKV